MIVAILIFVGYLVLTGIRFGITPSISASHYNWRERGTSYEALFTLFCWGITFSIISTWLDNTSSNIQFIPFLAAAGLGFVGASPLFKDDELENRVHSISAMICAVGSYLWAFIDGNIWLAIIAILITIPIYFKTKNRIYWAEIIAFIHLFIQLILV